MARRLPTITLRWLRARGACPDGRARFVQVFGKEARLAPSRDALRKAAQTGLDLLWLYRKLGGDSSTRVIVDRICCDAKEAWRHATRRRRARIREIVESLTDDDTNAFYCGDYTDPDEYITALAALVQRLREVGPRLEATLAELREKRSRHVTPAFERASGLMADELGLP